jgi:hypothetical protein
MRPVIETCLFYKAAKQLQKTVGRRHNTNILNRYILYLVAKWITKIIKDKILLCVGIILVSYHYAMYQAAKIIITILQLSDTAQLPSILSHIIYYVYI